MKQFLPPGATSFCLPFYAAFNLAQNPETGALGNGTATWLQHAGHEFQDASGAGKSAKICARVVPLLIIGAFAQSRRQRAGLLFRHGRMGTQLERQPIRFTFSCHVTPEHQSRWAQVMISSKEWRAFAFYALSEGVNCRVKVAGNQRTLAFEKTTVAYSSGVNPCCHSWQPTIPNTELFQTPYSANDATRLCSFRSWNAPSSKLAPAIPLA